MNKFIQVLTNLQDELKLDLKWCLPASEIGYVGDGFVELNTIYEKIEQKFIASKIRQLLDQETSRMIDFIDRRNEAIQAAIEHKSTL